MTTAAQPPLPLVMVSGRLRSDAALIKRGTMRILALNPAQTLASAVRAAQDALRDDYPMLHLDAIQDLIRPAMPQTLSLDEIFGPGIDAPPPAPVSPAAVAQAPTPRLRRVGRTALVAAVAATSVGLGYAVSNVQLRDEPTVGSFEKDPEFQEFAQAGHEECSTIGAFRARCIDDDGHVMLASAGVDATSATYYFEYDDERVILRIFPHDKAAQTWARSLGVKHSTRNLRREGRFVLFGSDPVRISEYGDLLREQINNTQPGQVPKLPKRLAALALGTLGVTPGQPIMGDARRAASALVMGDIGFFDPNATPLDLLDEPVLPVTPVAPPAPPVSPTLPPVTPPASPTTPPTAPVTPPASPTTPPTTTPTAPPSTTPTTPPSTTPTTPPDSGATLPVEPTVPTTPTTPSEPPPSGPTTPVEPTNPAQPTDPTQPSDPTAPSTDPTDPTDPGTDPSVPSDPTTDPTVPTDPTTDPAQPTDPVTDQPAADPAPSERVQSTARHAVHAAAHGHHRHPGKHRKPTGKHRKPHAETAPAMPEPSSTFALL